MTETPYQKVHLVDANGNLVNLLAASTPTLADLSKQGFVSTIAWVPLALASGWSNFGNGYPALCVRKHATGTIEIKGLIKKTGTPTVNETIATLPVSCTPLENRIIPSVSTVDTSSMQLGALGLYSNSNLVYIAGSTGYFSTEHSWQSEQDTGIFFGDSITYGYGLSSPSTQRWSYLVSSSLSIKEDNQGIAGSPLQNSGASGSSVAGIIGNGYDTYQARVLNRFPDKIFLVYGTNDIFDTLPGASIDTFNTQYQAILTAILRANIKASSIILGCPPYMSSSVYANPAYNCSLAKHTQYIQAVKKLASSNGVKYADLYTPLLNGGGDNLLQSDGIHPTMGGHQIIANAMLSASYV